MKRWFPVVSSLLLLGVLAWGTWWSCTRMREVLENEIADRLKRIRGDIYTVSVFGGYRRQLQVISAQMGLTPEEIARQAFYAIMGKGERRNISRPS